MTYGPLWFALERAAEQECDRDGHRLDGLVCTHCGAENVVGQEC